MPNTPERIDVKLTITNSEELDQWMNERMDHDLVAIKGKAPEGATYDDGTPITMPVNIAWRDKATREIYAIEYATGQGN